MLNKQLFSIEQHKDTIADDVARFTISMIWGVPTAVGSPVSDLELAAPVRGGRKFDHRLHASNRSPRSAKIHQINQLN